MVQGIQEPGKNVAENDEDSISSPHIEGFAIISDASPEDDAWMDYEIDRILDLERFPDLPEMLREDASSEDDFDTEIDADVTIAVEHFHVLPGIDVEIRDVNPHDLSYSSNPGWHFEMNNKHASGADGSYAGITGSTPLSERLAVIRDRKNELDARVMLFNQLQWLEGEVAAIAERVAQYISDLANIDKQIFDVCRSQSLVKLAGDRARDLPEDMTMERFYREHYANKVLADAPDNLIGAMQNPLTVDDHVVYSDGNNFYRLDLDENGDAKIDRDTGLPVRHYYSDPSQIAEITHQIMVEGKLTGEFTPQSRDMMNIRFHELLSVGSMTPQMKGYLQEINPPPPSDTPSEPIGRTMTMERMQTICDQTTCILVDEETMLREKRTEVERQIDQELEQYQSLEKKYGPLPGFPDFNIPAAPAADNRHSDVAAEPLDPSEIAAVLADGSEEQADSQAAANETDQTNNTTTIVQGPAPVFDDGKMPEAVANLIEAGSVDAELLTYVLADLPADDQGRILQKLEQQGVTITNPGTTVVSPDVLAFAEPPKPEVFGGAGLHQNIPAPAEDLQVTHIQPISVASQELDDVPAQGPDLQSAFASAVSPKAPEPQPEPQGPAPNQHLNASFMA